MLILYVSDSTVTVEYNRLSGSACVYTGQIRLIKPGNTPAAC